MHILFLDQFGDLGGAQQCLLEVISAARKRGWTARLAAPDGDLLRAARECGAEVETLPCGPYGSGRKSARDALRFAWQAVAQAARVRGRPADLVYVNGPRLLPAAALAGRAPLLFHCHSRLPEGASRALAGRALRMARPAVVACCRYVAEPLLPYIEPGRFHVVHNGVSGPEVLPVKPWREPWRIGVVGRIAPEKGQAEFLRAAAMLEGGCRFVIAGDALFGDPAARKYAEEVRDLARGLEVEFTGWLPRVTETLAALHVLVVPSGPEEGTTRVILEAYAAGVPVVAFRSGGIPEVVADGRTGFLVEPRTAAALAGRLRALLANPERLREAAAEARRCWRERFTVARFQNRILKRMEAAAGRGIVAPSKPPGRQPTPAQPGIRSA